MKPGKPHPVNALSAAFVRSAKPGRHADGGGLYLEVDDSGARRWTLRTVVMGSRKDIGLGSARLVSLADARIEAARLRRIAREGGDPLAERQATKVAAMTFDEAAPIVRDKLKRDALSGKKPWTEKHGDQWLKSVQDHASPVFGSKRIGYITPNDIYRAIDPIWQAKGPTAARVLARISVIMDWAKATGRRTGENPVWEARALLGKQLHETQHNRAIPFAEIPAFYQGIDDLAETPSVKLALRFMILNANRTSEVRFARVSEIDLDSAAWEIPGERMKARRPHRVPMSDEAVAVAREALKLPRTGDYLFTGQDPSEPINRDALLDAIKRAGYAATSHGCRSSFKDWANETTTFPEALSEAALAHALKGKTLRAYQRGDLFDRRRELMAAWAGYLTSKSADVVQLRKAEA